VCLIDDDSFQLLRVKLCQSVFAEQSLVRRDSPIA
jgi:hypothetical protein